MQWMTGHFWRHGGRRWLAISMTCLLVLPLFAASVQEKKQQARSQFETAERMREELNGLPQKDRSRHEYQRVLDAYRRVYYEAPTSSKADASVVAVAELLAESGRAFNDEKTSRAAVAQYEFLRREYPGSKYRFEALFTIGQIYKDDLNEIDKARETFQEVIHRYPHMQQAADAREAINDLEQPHTKAKTHEARTADVKPQESHAPDSKAPELKPVDNSSETPRSTLPLVTGIRHWSTPDYTRVAIDLEQEVKYEAGRIPNPDRIFFDLHDTKLASTLVGKTFDVSDGFLRRIRIAQFQKGMVRVVLEVDDVSDYSAFLLPNPYRLIIDVHGRKPNGAQTLVAQAQKERETAALPATSGETSSASKQTPAVPSAPNPATSSVAAPAKSAAASARLEKPAAEPAKTSTAVFGPSPVGQALSKSETVEFGPRMEDGSFFSNGKGPKVEDKVSASADNNDENESTAAGTPESTKSEIANLKGHEVKATDRPTSQPTVQVVAPRGPDPSALGLKVGRIVIDAGHGGHDTGTIGPNGLLEKDLVLDVSLRLGRLLQGKMGAEVIYTRDDDTFVPLETRTAIANQQQADLFISVHANSSQDASARGVETYYLNFNPSPDALEVAARENAVSEKSVHELSDLVKKITLKDKVEESREFATDVQHSLYQGLAGKDKTTLRDRGVKKAPFIVLIGANMPSILAEISFVSNPGDEAKLRTPEYRQKIAESLYKGIARYINGLSGVKVASRTGAGEGQQ
jgi:N-acetylmuramoyl-L-alanine amidase